jgi:hypothetical protein
MTGGQTAIYFKLGLSSKHSKIIVYFAHIFTHVEKQEIYVMGTLFIYMKIFN